MGSGSDGDGRVRGGWALSGGDGAVGARQPCGGAGLTNPNPGGDYERNDAGRSGPTGWLSIFIYLYYEYTYTIKNENNLSIYIIRNETN